MSKIVKGEVQPGLKAVSAIIDALGLEIGQRGTYADCYEIKKDLASAHQRIHELEQENEALRHDFIAANARAETLMQVLEMREDKLREKSEIPELRSKNRDAG